MPVGNYEVRSFYNNSFNLVASHRFAVKKNSGEINFADVPRNDFQLFGDPEQSRIVGMQLSTMKKVFDFPLAGENIYSSDIINDSKSYGYGRGSNKVFILKKDSKGVFAEQGIIDLPFAPRTGAKNRKLGLTLITGSRKPMYAIIDTKNDTLVATGGRNELTYTDDSNHGSHWATGHGVWLTDNHFVVPDREARDLILYEVNSKTLKVKELNRIDTPSSVHTVIGSLNNDKGTYYAVTEGSDSSRPAIMELKFNGKNINSPRIVMMPGTDATKMTGHHAKPLPDGVHIYMGTSDGGLHVINKKTMKIVKTIKAGKGAGHTTLIKKHNLAVITNHTDTVITVINTLTHTKVKDITVSGESIKDTALQSHTARISPDSKYYYNFATDNGYYYRVNLLTLEKDKQFYTGGTPKQASQPGELN